MQGGALSAVVIVCALAVSAGRVGAQSGTLPAGWSTRDIGSTGVVGSASVASGTWTLDGSGANVWEHVGRVPLRLPASHRRRRHPRAGREPRERPRMVQGRRDDPRNTQRQFAQRVHDGHAERAAASYRRGRTAGGTTTRSTGVSGAAPVWLRLVRQGKSVHRLSFGERHILDDDRQRHDQHDGGGVRRDWR